MIRKRIATSRWSLAAIIAGWTFVTVAPAQPARTASIDGVYNGSYASDQGPVKFKLSITQQDNGILAGRFTLYLPEGSDTKAYTCDLTGNVQNNGTFLLKPGKWETPPPSGFEIAAGMNGLFDPAGGSGVGQISGKMRDGSRPKFEAIRDTDESAKRASAIVGRKAVAPSAISVAPPARRPTAANPAVAAPSSPAQGPGVNPPSAVNGVYTGTFAGKEGPTKFKLTITQQDRTVAGVLTFYLPEGSGENAYTFEFTGFYIPAHGTQPNRIQLVRKKWETPPPSRLLYVAGMEGVFDPTGGNGAGQISGLMSDSSHSQFQAIRDATESANLARARLRNNLRPSIAGVFNGTYTRENEPPAKFKLTITHPGASLAGVATIYLPTDSGTKAYTYSLKGVEVDFGNFNLKVNDWETIPPKDFKNFKAMGFNGTFVPDMTQNTARIISVQTSGSDLSFFVPTFEATWDATESADIKGAIAAQKAVDAADQIAALKAHAEAMKSAPPKQLASKDLVRKSKAYWDAYETDMVREVFDGGFGADVDNDSLFRTLFCTYVETFSKKCSAYLPAKHETVTVTQSTNRKFDQYHNLVSENSQSVTVEVDSRFASKYRQFAKFLASSAQGMRTAVSAMASNRRPSDVLNEMLAPARDMERFFATETGRSAAMRQLTENFLRGATGELSLQQAGAKIDGAEAETDKALPPGRFARFVDGANAFYRDPANAKYKSSHDTAFCQRLAEKYDRVMTREEEYYYANDFFGRFFGQIMQPRAYCKDPEWPRLHPAVEECIAEIN